MTKRSVETQGQKTAGDVVRFDRVLGGSGGTSTLRYDPQGKSYAAMLLALPVHVPAAWEEDGLLAGPVRAMA